MVTLPNLELFDGQLVIKSVTIVTVVVSIIIMVGLTLFVKKTKIGRAMMAVSEDKGAAQLMGINVNGTDQTCFYSGLFQNILYHK